MQRPLLSNLAINSENCITFLRTPDQSIQHSIRFVLSFCLSLFRSYIISQSEEPFLKDHVVMLISQFYTILKKSINLTKFYANG